LRYSTRLTLMFQVAGPDAKRRPIQRRISFQHVALDVLAVVDREDSEIGNRITVLIKVQTTRRALIVYLLAGL
jgi:hypothetical protein